MVEFEIRMVVPNDRDDIEILTRKFVEEQKHEAFDEKRFEWGLLRRIYDELQRHGIFVAKEKQTGNLVGIIFGELKVDPFGVSEVVFKELYIDETYRGHMLGKMLIEQAIEHLKKINVKKIMVNIPMDSEELEKLFTRFNFKPKFTIMELDLEE